MSEFNLSIGTDAARRKRPLEQLNTAAQQMKAGDFTSTFTKMGTMIGDALRTGQVRDAASSL